MKKLSNLAAKETYTLQLTDPVTEELLFADDARTVPVTVTIYGQSSPKHRNAVSAMQNRAIQRGSKKFTAESMRQESIDLLVAVSKEASPHEFFSDEGPLDEEGFRDLYSNGEFQWLKVQVEDALNDLSNFIKA